VGYRPLVEQNATITLLETNEHAFFESDRYAILMGYVCRFSAERLTAAGMREPLSDPRDTVAAPTACATATSSTRRFSYRRVRPPRPVRPRLPLPPLPLAHLLAHCLQVPARPISSLLPASRGLPTFFFFN
jgi:hypothetical protein